MTVLADSNSITPTANAIAVAQTDGASIVALMTLAKQRAIELQILMKQIISFTPGGDANLSSLNAILAELA